MADIIVPAIGESITSGILAAWLKSDGESVSEGDELFELETDKATLAVPSPATGTLHISAAEGDEVSVDQVVGTVSEGAGGDAPAASTPAASSTPTPAADASANAGEAAKPAPKLSPAVKRVVDEHGLDPASITGTGPGGRITKADALKAADGGTATPAKPAPPTASATPSATPATPALLRDGQRREPMSTVRRRIAENLVASKQNSAHVTTFNEVDMSAIMKIRSQYKEEFLEKHGVRLGFMSFFIKASQVALEETPQINAFLDGTDIIYNEAVNIGVALSSEKGLLTPVIRNVAAFDFAGIESTIVDFIDRANKRRLMPDEMSGATFTISNGGVFGSMLSTPIPSPPQTAVLGMHAIEKRPVVVNDEIVIRPMMYLALTYDHRMVDGREAVTFLGRIRDLVQDPTGLLLGL